MQPTQDPTLNPNPIPPPSASPLYHYPSPGLPYYYPPPPPESPAPGPPRVDPTTTYPNQDGLLVASGGYYFNPNSGPNNRAAKEAVWQYAPDPGGQWGAHSVTTPSNGTEQLPVTQLAPTGWTNITLQTCGNGTLMKQQRKTKVVQSAYCEVCKVDCNSKEVLEQHKLGKKHKKNLEKLLRQATSGSSTTAESIKPVIGPQESPNNGKTGNGRKSKKKAAETLEDLERKRRKVVEGGAAVEAVRTCTMCNVVCNSETVFRYHLAGQKHLTMLKKLGVAPIIQL